MSCFVHIASGKDRKVHTVEWSHPIEPLPNGIVVAVVGMDGKVYWNSKDKDCWPPTSLLSQMAVDWFLGKV